MMVPVGLSEELTMIDYTMVRGESLVELMMIDYMMVQGESLGELMTIDYTMVQEELSVDLKI